MIQTMYAAEFAIGIPQPEFYVRNGSKTNTHLVTAGQYGQPGFIARLGGQQNGQPGYMDIVDIVIDPIIQKTIGYAYEIKHQNEIAWGIAEINWYTGIYNSYAIYEPVTPKLMVHGSSWPVTWELVGTDPYVRYQLLYARLGAPGVIIYKNVPKRTVQPPIGVHVWEWDPNSRKVEKRQLQAVLATCEAMGATEESIEGTAIQAAGVTAIVWGLWKVGKAAIGFLVAGPPGAGFAIATP